MGEDIKSKNGEMVSDAEKLSAELGDFVKNAKAQENYESWREYEVPAEMSYEVEPLLEKLDKAVVDYKFDEIGLKYVNDLDDFLGVDVSDEDFYDFEAGHIDEVAYSDAVYRNRLKKINELGDEPLNGYGFTEGFNFFDVQYEVNGGDNEEEILTYERDLLGDRKNVPNAMTTGLAELLIRMQQKNN